MSQLTDNVVNQCDVCGWKWIPKPGVTYTHCTSGKCRSRLWNGSTRKYAAPVNVTASIAKQAIDNTSKPHNPKTCEVYKCGMCAAAK